MDIIEMSPYSSVGSGGDRLKKKMKGSQELVFVRVEVEKNFNQGETHSGKCNINIEEVKGGRGIDWVSWPRTEDEKKMEEQGKMEAEGESEKRGWIRTLLEAISDERFMAVKGSWKGNDQEMFLVCIYEPHVSKQKSSLWVRLSALMDRWQGAWCLFRDLNVVRGSDDRFNSQVNVKETNEFNEFINDIRLVEVPMGVRRFTKVSDDGLKFIVALDQKLSDHCPIVLKDAELDFGPKPFRVFNMCMEESDFIQVIEEAWKKDVRSFWSDCKFRDRLKNVKASLRCGVRRDLAAIRRK
ncbi:RNA-directed DNA polymerase, eukaryota [Tanacetum coccineum]